MRYGAWILLALCVLALARNANRATGQDTGVGLPGYLPPDPYPIVRFSMQHPPGGTYGKAPAGRWRFCFVLLCVLQR